MINNPKIARIVAAVVVAMLVITLAASLFGCGASGQASTRSAAPPAKDPVSGLAFVAAADLPAEARETLKLIDQGGPFPYRRDGVVFGNFERLLPQKQRGYYREYTVRTPGEKDRGARRIVTGKGGERYYTEDHYESFRRVAADEGTGE
ncbi:guanine-specific ribonuclease N1 and T1 [Kribbella flavida DSM 17836]|uniref:Guanine-specific ribonuclease N1 and T1 n=1 Tax=Kribbella flavida (strain DSM 17836 / JCM 10339 / NBRC 14399) TaxID=479435 RepID=D2Q0C4_KRIFD|nr:ribonuclease domain-containing protein [Kribbella flavida]ADB31916.1 guanine-specific ribonuclease N1 and T1 [Kribbella flavida DSM 17836]